MDDEVLAVLVVYERDLEHVLAWPWLQQTLAASDATPPQSLRLRRVLVYDNSQHPRARPDRTADGRVIYRHDSRNGGTAAAYVAAATIAREENIEWLLLVDHDTSLPADLLHHAGLSLAQHRGGPPGVLLPWVSHADAVVSPSHISVWGTIRPLRKEARPKATERLTGIASGSLVRTRALNEVFPPPSELWLDYVDHWLCAQIQGRGWPIVVFPSQIKHDLSLVEFASITPARLRSILDGEARFTRDLSWQARCLHPLRLLARALRYASSNRALAAVLMSAAVRKRPGRGSDHV
jgi:GT2 family glycosyltransferase